MNLLLIHILATPIVMVFFMLSGITVIGLIRNPRQSLIAFDQWVACALLPDSYADETISAWTHRKGHKRAERFINFIFNDPMHCASAYVSEMKQTQTAKEYR